jgi:hypothetical protein
VFSPRGDHRRDGGDRSQGEEVDERMGGFENQETSTKGGLRRRQSRSQSGGDGVVCCGWGGGLVGELREGEVTF